MKNMHLSDQQLQDIADRRSSPGREILKHLEHCSECRSALQFYQELPAALKDTDLPALPAGFAWQVAQKVQSESTASRYTDFFEPLLAVFFFLLGAGSLYFGLGSESDIKVFLTHYLDTLFSWTQTLQLSLFSSETLLLPASLVLLAVFLLDKLLMQFSGR
jgi:hypothetical protein